MILRLLSELLPSPSVPHISEIVYAPSNRQRLINLFWYTHRLFSWLAFYSFQFLCLTPALLYLSFMAQLQKPTSKVHLTNCYRKLLEEPLILEESQVTAFRYPCLNGPFLPTPKNLGGYKFWPAKVGVVPTGPSLKEASSPVLEHAWHCWITEFAFERWPQCYLAHFI